ncbi:NADPH--cytochrome P450 reductase, putative [Plasmodium malariae]|uniref:NADPH--cytochrome P450 reductase, putative n=1 Tax=Plasmodium malariae TaxID=5858 RepID=A0A1D3SQV7_PLAMA|nr:NADPH--cytochrome P450 reductase, putative [Plasmodium malariae]SCO94070.1 NADPH--cytochrome P450 reductase, putative [Plasmodium malariae]
MFNSTMDDDIKKRSKILLLYGSEYGTAYDCCRNVLYELYMHFHIDFFCLNDVNLMSFYRYENIIIIVSTTGYGCYTHNMSKFWKDLHKTNLVFYDTMNFHLFGLGDSSYDNYNIVAKKLRKKLKSLDANIVNYNLGNYQHPSMHFTNFNIWKANVYEFLKKNFFHFQINDNIPCLFNVKHIYSHSKNEQQKDNGIKISQKEEITANKNGKTKIKKSNSYKVNTIKDDNVTAPYDETNNGKVSVVVNVNTNKYQAKEEQLEESCTNIGGEINKVVKKLQYEYSNLEGKKCHNIYENNTLSSDNIITNYADFSIDEYFCKSSNFMKFEVLKNEKCSDESYHQDVRYIDLIAPTRCFNVSDLIKVHPFLNEEKTKNILNLLKINYNDYIIIIQNDHVHCTNNTFIPVNKKIKILDLFIYFLDLNKIVTPFFFLYLSKKTVSDIHKKKFLQLADTNNISDYFSYVYQDKRSYYDIFFDFYNYIKIDVSFLINTLPSIQERCYSILNTIDSYYFLKNFNFYNLYYFSTNPNFSWIIHILKLNYYINKKKNALNILSSYTYNIMMEKMIYSLKYTNIIRNRITQNKIDIIELLVCLYETTINKNKKCVGLCSDYLINLKPGSCIYAKIENSLLCTNKNILNLNYRIIYISIGAAFSSLLGVIRHRHYLYNRLYKNKPKEKQNEKKNVYSSCNSFNKDLLFLGFRNRLNDFYFQEELQNYLYFNYIFVAFSRLERDNFLFYNEEVQKCSRDNTYNNSTNPNKYFETRENRIIQMNYEEMKQLLKEKKKLYVTDLILMLQDMIYEHLKNINTIILISGKSRPFSQNLIKMFANIIKQKEQNKSMEEINLFLKKKIDDFSIILESWY